MVRMHNKEVVETPGPGISHMDVWTRSDPRSVINLVPPAVGEAMLLAAKAKPDLFGVDERTLWNTLRLSNKCPSPTDNRLRLKFWDEYDRAQAELKNIIISNVTPGVCSREYFTQNYLASPEKVAWLLCPPASYVVKMEEALAFGIEQLRDILELPTTSPSGRVDTKLAELKAKIVAMMDIRVKGAITQKIEQKSMNINVQTSDKQVANRALQGSMEDIEKRLRELKKRDKVAGAGEIAIDAEVVK